MTYIVGVLHEDVGAIICDMRVSSADGEGENSALKSGLLFPGCLYGASGNVAEFRAFVHHCRYKLEGKPLDECWAAFLEITKGYPPRQDSFELLLLSRATGVPRLFRFSSRTRQVVECFGTASIGSGAALLDEALDRFEVRDFYPLWSLNRASGKPDVGFPYLYCLWLIEQVCGEEASECERRGVGGLFHYQYQTSEMDAYQEPAVYVVRAANTAFVYRVAFAREALVVDDPIANKTFVSLDTTADPWLESLDAEQLRRFVEEVVAEAKASQRYVFCGIGNAYAGSRGARVVSFESPGKEEMLFFGQDGSPSSKLEEAFRILDALSASELTTDGEEEPGMVLAGTIGSEDDTLVGLEELSEFKGASGVSLHFQIEDAWDHGPCILFDAGSHPRRSRLTVYVNEFRHLCIRLFSPEGSSAVLSAPVPFGPSGPVPVHAAVGVRNGQLLFMLKAFGALDLRRLRPPTPPQDDATLVDVTGHLMGADIMGQRAGRFLLYEMCCFRKLLGPEDLEGADRYFLRRIERPLAITEGRPLVHRPAPQEASEEVAEA